MKSDGEILELPNGVESDHFRSIPELLTIDKIKAHILESETEKLALYAIEKVRDTVWEDQRNIPITPPYLKPWGCVPMTEKEIREKPWRVEKYAAFLLAVDAICITFARFQNISGKNVVKWDFEFEYKRVFSAKQTMRQVLVEIGHVFETVAKSSKTSGQLWLMKSHPNQEKEKLSRVENLEANNLEESVKLMQKPYFLGLEVGHPVYMARWGIFG